VKFILIYTTCSSLNEAKSISETLLENNLIACSNIYPSIISLYKWNNKIAEDEECIIIMKAIEKNFNEIKKQIKKFHSYEIPCIVGLPITQIDDDYANWLLQSKTTKT
jgi:periplasmic divalent cation tolerance protein